MSVSLAYWLKAFAQNRVTDTEQIKISITLNTIEFSYVASFFIGCTRKNRSLNPNLIFPFMTHQRRYNTKSA